VLFPGEPPEGAGDPVVVEPVFALGGLFGIEVGALTHGTVPFGTVWFVG